MVVNEIDELSWKLVLLSIDSVSVLFTNTRTFKFKTAFTIIAFFAALNHNYTINITSSEP